MTGLLALVVAIPASVGAYGNSVDQGKFESYADANEVFSNEWTTTQGGYSNDMISASYGGSWDAAFSAANCQLLVAVDVHVATIAASSALAVISDEDEIVATGGGYLLPLLLGLLSNETADADCDTPVGPILIDVTTSSGWGEPAPFGALGDAIDALSGGRGGSQGNKIDQGRFYMDADVDDVVHNEWHLTQSVSSGAAAAANCQAVIAVHDSFVAAALGSAESRIEDSDSIVTTDDGAYAGTAQDTGNHELPLALDNDHTATDSCNQAIESITIIVRPEGVTIPPAS